MILHLFFDNENLSFSQPTHNSANRDRKHTISQNPTRPKKTRNLATSCETTQLLHRLQRPPQQQSSPKNLTIVKVRNAILNRHSGRRGSAKRSGRKWAMILVTYTFSSTANIRVRPSGRINSSQEVLLMKLVAHTLIHGTPPPSPPIKKPPPEC